jgi:hypothetical protein
MEMSDFTSIDVQGARILIDNTDLHHIEGKKLLLVKSPRGKTKYVMWRIKRCAEHPRGSMRRLHREIMEAKEGDIVDHINGDTLDNRRSNLRIVDFYENARNKCQPSSRKLPSLIQFEAGKYFFVVKQSRVGRSKRSTLLKMPFDDLCKAVIFRDKWIRQNDWFGLAAHYKKLAREQAQGEKAILVGQITELMNQALKNGAEIARLREALEAIKDSYDEWASDFAIETLKGSAK